jgi:Ca2+-binding RTX toxin-like protein
LTNNVENLELLGPTTATLDGVGNGLDNLITGHGGADHLDGREGRDTLEGRYGADTLKDNIAAAFGDVPRAVSATTPT